VQDMKSPLAIHKFFLFNNDIIDSYIFANCFDNEGLIIYDVLRVVNKIPLFFEEHFQRLLYSANLTKFKIWKNKDDIIKDIAQLINLNQAEFGNVRIVFQYKPGERNYIVYFIKHLYPTEHEYRKGVSTCLLRTKRSTPKAKVQHDDIRKKVLKIIKEKNVYEVLLVDENDTIREGSKSNLFFVKNNQLHTCPADLVLNGITRKCIFNICEKNGIPIHESEVKIDDLMNMESAFITGTSPKLLPIEYIEEIKYNVYHKLTRDLMQFYDQMITQYLFHYKP